MTPPRRSRMIVIGLPIALSAAAMTIVAVLAACVLLLIFAVTGAASAVLPSVESSPPTVPSQGADSIPPSFLVLYRAAARRYGLDWAVLAGIGRVECDHGQDPAAACSVEGAVNSAGAGGPAQFLASTWARYGVSASGSGTPDRWNAADAIFSMANYLRASGAPAAYERAIYAYNHASWYVAEVLSWAARYRARYAGGGP